MALGLFNQSRIGSMFGQPQAVGGGGVPAGTELGKGSAVVGANSNTSLDTAVVADGNAIYPAFPTVRNEGLTRSGWSENTNSAPSGSNMHFMISKVPVADTHSYQVRTGSAASSLTFDWYWFSVST